nr:hypothetical protein [Bacteroides intestinalis]
MKFRNNFFIFIAFNESYCKITAYRSSRRYQFYGLNDQFHRLQKCVVGVSVKLVIGQVISVHPVPSGVRTFAKIESGMKSRCEK